MYLIDPRKPQFKANLHSHTKLSDGSKTPQELKTLYMERGYHILSITDHDVPHDHSCLNEENFLTITGYEGYARPEETAKYDVYAPEVHLNFYARDPHNETMICYDPRYCQFMSLMNDGRYVMLAHTTDKAPVTAYAMPAPITHGAFVVPLCGTPLLRPVPHIKISPPPESGGNIVICAMGLKGKLSR